MSKGDLDFKSFAENVENYVYIDTLSEKMNLAGRRGLMYAGKFIIKETSEKIKNPPKTGVKYKRMRVRSSRAGEFPANQTGKLRRSLGFQVDGTKRLYVGAREKYAGFLAFGTKKMGKRLFIGKVIEDNKKEIYDIIFNEVNKELKI